MKQFRIALANIQYPATPEESVSLAEQAITQSSEQRANLICFPECFVPGYRGIGKLVPPVDPVFLERAWAGIAAAAARASLAVILGKERIVDAALLVTALVVDHDGKVLGFQDKVQIDPSEEGTYSAGCGIQIFRIGPLTFGVVICHELPGDGPLGGCTWGPDRIPSALSSGRTGKLPTHDIRRSGQLHEKAAGVAKPRQLMRQKKLILQNEPTSPSRGGLLAITLLSD